MATLNKKKGVAYRYQATVDPMVVPLSHKTSYREIPASYHKISHSLEPTGLDVKMPISLGNFACSSATVLPSRLPNSRVKSRRFQTLRNLRIGRHTACGNGFQNRATAGRHLGRVVVPRSSPSISETNPCTHGLFCSSEKFSVEMD